MSRTQRVSSLGKFHAQICFVCFMEHPLALNAFKRIDITNQSKFSTNLGLQLAFVRWIKDTFVSFCSVPILVLFSNEMESRERYLLKIETNRKSKVVDISLCELSHGETKEFLLPFLFFILSTQ